jgi:acylphosphatase
VIAKRVRVTGLVQGVFFRDTCRRVAATNGVAGWVRNLPDGGVEALFEGAPEAVAELVEWSRRGPAKARVTGLVVTDEQPGNLTDFEILPTPR